MYISTKLRIKPNYNFTECKCNNKNNNINKENYEKYIKKRIYYFKSYNNVSGNESSNMSTSILPFQDINYYKKHNLKYKNFRNSVKNNKYRFRINNKKHKYIINFSKFSIKNNNKNSNKINKNELLAWTLDSGATCHMTGNLNILKNIKKYKKKFIFQMAAAYGHCTKVTILVILIIII